jgi:hypothetical protein
MYFQGKEEISMEFVDKFNFMIYPPPFLLIRITQEREVLETNQKIPTSCSTPSASTFATFNPLQLDVSRLHNSNDREKLKTPQVLNRI